MARRIYRGGIYPDFSSRGKRRNSSGIFGARFVRGSGMVSCRRWSAEIMYHGKRYRFRNTNYRLCEIWLNDMRARFNDVDYEED